MEEKEGMEEKGSLSYIYTIVCLGAKGKIGRSGELGLVESNLDDVHRMISVSAGDPIQQLGAIRVTSDET